jgi:NADPH:quinone reductase-like Zn-dependent oxidoreductase
MAPTNKAAFLPVAQAHPMEVLPAEYPTAGNGEVIVKVVSISGNPMDWYIQIMGNQLFSFLQYPYVGGDDLAGTICQGFPNRSSHSRQSSGIVAVSRLTRRSEGRPKEERWSQQAVETYEER